jgi:murein DD-endopeptidase MepM/ murein hydrolase activator NlpD
VAGVKPGALVDTFADARGSGRVHDAIDIMAPRGTPVLAASDGKLVKLFTSQQGGLTIYQFDPSQTYAYYYAHLDAYAPGIHEGSELKRGDVIGQVGSTGNASPDAPHLHFAVFVLGAERKWWQGTAIDPYPLLAKPEPAP